MRVHINILNLRFTFSLYVHIGPALGTQDIGRLNFTILFFFSQSRSYQLKIAISQVLLYNGYHITSEILKKNKYFLLM